LLPRSSFVILSSRWMVCHQRGAEVYPN